jgi:hypothetical protein
MSEANLRTSAPKWAAVVPLCLASLLALAGCSDEPEGYSKFSGSGTCIVDEDGDGYGIGCTSGDDCNDGDASKHDGCNRCELPEQGCPCEPGTEPVQCMSQALIDADTLLCKTGTRFCQDGAWSECLGVVSFEADVLASRREASQSELGVQAQALLGEPGTTSCSPCKPSCFPVEDPLDIVDGGLDSTNSDDLTWGGGGGVTVATQGGGSTNIIGSTSDCADAPAADTDCDGIPDTLDTVTGNDATFGTTAETLYMDLAPGETETAQVILGTWVRAADLYFLLDMTESQDFVKTALASALNVGNFFADPAAVTCADTDFDGAPNDELKDQGITGNVKCLVRDGSFGAGWVREIPFSGPDASGLRYGEADEYLFENSADVGTDETALQTRIDGFAGNANYGGPNAQVQALHALATGDEAYMGWDRSALPYKVGCAAGTFGYPCFRDQAMPVVVMLTGSPLYNGPTPGAGNLGTNGATPYPVAYPASIHQGQVNRGTFHHYLIVPGGNETVATAYVLGNHGVAAGVAAGPIDDDLLTFTGDTSGMAANLTAADLECDGLTSDLGADAVFEFEVATTGPITLSTEGTRFSRVLGLIREPTTGLTPVTVNTVLAGAPAGDTVASALDLGTLARGTTATYTGTTEGAASNYPREFVGCYEEAATADTSDHGADQILRFQVAQDMTVHFETDDATPLKSLSLYEGAPNLGSWLSSGVNTGTDFEVPAADNFNVPGATLYNNTVRLITGYTGSGDQRQALGIPTAGLAADAPGFLFSNAGCAVDTDTSPDFVVHFVVTNTTTLRIETSGDGAELGTNFRHLIGLFNEGTPGTLLGCAQDNLPASHGSALIGNRAVIERTLAAGNYGLIVRGRGNADTGNVRITMRDVGFSPAPVACTLHEEGAPSSFEYALQACNAGFTAPCPGQQRTYYMVLRGQDANDAEGGSGAFTLTMRDVDLGGTIDVCGGSTADSYTGTLRAGTYHAIVKGTGPGEEGQYQLTVGDPGLETSGDFTDLRSWTTARNALSGAGVRVVGLHTGVQAAATEQLQTLATATGAVDATSAPLTVEIDPASATVADDIGRAVVGALSSLTAATQLDVSLRLVPTPDAPSPAFTFSHVAVDEATDGCDAPVNDVHQNCVAGATPRFDVTFANPPAPFNVPPNPLDANGGYWQTLELVGDGTYVLERIPVYIVPSDVTSDTAPLSYEADASYWQDFGSPNCLDTERPDWSNLGWSATVPPDTTMVWELCTAETLAALNSCTAETLARITSGGSCALDGDCPYGFCQAGTCQYAEGPTCTEDTTCGKNGVCNGGRCAWTSLPIDPHAVLGSLGGQPYMRVQVNLYSSTDQTAAPILHTWRIEYDCQSAE